MYVLAPVLTVDAAGKCGVVQRALGTASIWGELANAILGHIGRQFPAEITGKYVWLHVVLEKDIMSEMKQHNARKK